MGIEAIVRTKISNAKSYITDDSLNCPWYELLRRHYPLYISSDPSCLMIHQKKKKGSWPKLRDCWTLARGAHVPRVFTEVIHVKLLALFMRPAWMVASFSIFARAIGRGETAC